MATSSTFKSEDTTLYLAIAAAIAVIVGIVWCFSSGPCAGSDSPDTPPGVGPAIQDAIESAAQLATGSATDLGNETNGLIFGGGA
jgi:hypothetical protein